MDRRAPETGRILCISLAHLLNDCYMNYIPTLLPFMVAAGMSVTRGAFLVSAFTVTSSMLQPVSGYLVDRKNQGWLVYAGTLWMAVLLGAVGILQNYFFLVATVTLAGLGTAAFHPQASAMVTALSGARKGFFQALFITFGNFGWALTPLVAVPFVQGHGLDSTPLLVLPGILAAVLLRFTAPKMSERPAKSLSPPLMPLLRTAGKELGKIVLVVAIRSITSFSLIAFLQLYLQQKNISLIHGSRLLSLMLFTGALGGLAGGWLSDLFGRKPVIAGSLFLASPLLYLFLRADGPLSYFLLALAGAAIPASFSVTVVVAQEIIPKNAAMAAGLMLGFGLGLGGLGVGLVGILVEQAGIENAFLLLASLPLLAAILALGIKTAPGVK